MTARHELHPLRGRVKQFARKVGIATSPAPPASDGLTNRQCQVLGLVAEGNTTSEIATILGITPGTVETHVRAVLRHLGATTRLQAASMVFDNPIE
jgi:DNA-binding NarL/FixJ family response regulator